jgi:MFS transporter, FSR family, fosmidomycin resistance protein
LVCQAPESNPDIEAASTTQRAVVGDFFGMRSANISVVTAQRSVSRWRVLGIACLAHVLHDGYSSMLYLLLPSWQTEFALNLLQVGILKTLYSATMAMGQVPAARLGEQRGEKLPLVIGTVVTAAAVLAIHWATAPLVLGLLLLVGGLGASVQHPLASTLISRAYAGSALRTTLGTYNFAGDIGKMAIPALLTVLIAILGWRSGTEVIGAFGLVIAAVLFLALTRTETRFATAAQRMAADQSRLPEAARRRGFAALSAVGTLDSATRSGFLTLLPFVLAHRGADSTSIGAALSLIFAGGAAGKFAYGALATRIGILRTVAVTKAVAAVAIMLLSILPLSSSFALMPVLGVALNGTSSVLYGTVPELARDGREARAFGFFYTVTLAADAFAPVFYGVVGDVIGVTASILLVGAINLAALPFLSSLRSAFPHSG